MVVEPPASVEAAAEWLRKHFASEASRGVRATFQLQLTGPGGGALLVAIDDGGLDVRRERVESPDVLVRSSVADWLGVLAGRENAELLFMAGRIQIEGDLALALRLRSFFRRRAP